MRSDRTIIDDLSPEALAALQRHAFMTGAFHMLIWLIAFYEAKRGR